LATVLLVAAPPYRVQCNCVTDSWTDAAAAAAAAAGVTADQCAV